jgi:hypothetical protein
LVYCTGWLKKFDESFNALKIQITPPYAFAVYRQVIILNFLSIGEGSSYELHHIPFAYKVDVTSQDYTDWETYEFEFCGQVNGCCQPVIRPDYKAAVLPAGTRNAIGFVI